MKNLLIAIPVLAVSGILAGCGDAGASGKTLSATDQQAAAGKIGGKKGAAGGGVFAAPEPAKPGEKVGAPPPGAKSGGG